MKIHTRLISMGLALTLFLGVLSACGEQSAEQTTPPEELPTASTEPVPTQTPTAEPVLTPTPEPEPSPESVEPTYDVFSDPNVLWGEKERVAGVNTYYEAGRVSISQLLESTMTSASEDNLIAFALYPMGFRHISTNDGISVHPIDMAPIKADELVIPDVFNPNNVLYELVASVDAQIQTAPVDSYVYDFYVKQIQPLKCELQLMTRAVLEAEYGKTLTNEIYQNNAAAVASELVETDEHFRELYDQYHLYYYAYEDFWFSWITQQTLWIRAMMTERGFIPVYGTEEAYAAAYARERWSPFKQVEYFDPIGAFNELAFVFVGTSQQIEDLRDYIHEQALDAYAFISVGKSLD